MIVSLFFSCLLSSFPPPFIVYVGSATQSSIILLREQPSTNDIGTTALDFAEGGERLTRYPRIAWGI